MGDVRTVCVSREQASEGSQHGRCQNCVCVAGAGKRRESAWEMSELCVCRGSRQAKGVSMGDVRTVCVSREQASEGSQHGRCQNCVCVAGAGKRRESAWEMSEQWVCRGSRQAKGVSMGDVRTVGVSRERADGPGAAAG